MSRDPGRRQPVNQSFHFITDPLIVANLICASVKLHCVECSVPYPLIEQSFRYFESKIIKGGVSALTKNP